MGLYTEAADIIRKAKAKKASVKTLVLSRSTYPNKKQLYALVCETIKNTEILRQVEERVGLLEKIPILQRDEELLHVLLYDQLIGRGIKGSHNFRVPVQRFRSLLKAEFKKLSDDETWAGKPKRERASSALPRYVRVNLLKTSKEEVVSAFLAEGWKLTDIDTEKSFVHAVGGLRRDDFMPDPHLNDVLVFPAGTDLHDHPLTESGEIILQDKASCFPAHILQPPDGAVVIDACAAPGNKTSHLASLMHDTGEIFAFDKSGGRLKTMETLLKKAGVTCAQTSHADFLRVDPRDPAYADVKYVLVDPSCSGSGMVNRLEESTNEEQTISKDRLKSLSNFQISIVKHALKFPGVERVVYSTCSVYEEENEVVIDEIMSQVKGQFILQEVKPDWPRRGVKGHYCWDKCIRMSPTQDLTNGFFVASFERIPSKKNTKADVDKDENSSTEETSEKKTQKKKRKKKTVSEDLLDGNTNDIQVSSNHENDQPVRKKGKKGVNPESEDRTEVTQGFVVKKRVKKHKVRDIEAKGEAENEVLNKKHKRAQFESEERENETFQSAPAEETKKKHKHKKRKKE